MLSPLSKVFINYVLSTFMRFKELAMVGIVGIILIYCNNNLPLNTLGYMLTMYSITMTLNATASRYIYEPLIMCITRCCRVVRKEFGDMLKDVVAVKPFGFTAIAQNFLKHRIGITACITSITRTFSVIDVGLEATKIGSMLGLEDTILNNLFNIGISKIPSLVSSGTPVLSQNVEKEEQILEEMLDENNLEDSLPLLATAATLAGKEITGVDMSSFIQKQANNLKALKVVSEEVKKSLEALGVIKNPNYSLVIEAAQVMESIRDDINECKLVLHTKANEFMKPEMMTKLDKIKKVAMDLEVKMKLITNPSLKQHQSVTTINTLIAVIYDICHQVSVIKAGYNLRVEPVGVCFRGQRQIGKSNLMPIIYSKVKKIIASSDEYRQLFADPQLWQTWHVQSRDEFDVGYYGQEFCYADDGFQAKDNSDHLKWINFISPEPIGTVQADLSKKGYPFEAKVCGVTCNVWPRTSITINCIEALHARFPISVEVQVKEGMKCPSKNAEFDDEFKWLNLYVAPMLEHVKDPDYSKMKPVNVNELAEMVVEAMASKQRLYMSKLAAQDRLSVNVDVEEDIFSDDEMNLIELFNEVEDEEEQETLDFNTIYNSASNSTTWVTPSRVEKLLLRYKCKLRYIRANVWLKWRLAYHDFIRNHGMPTYEKLQELFEKTIHYERAVTNQVEVPKELLMRILVLADIENMCNELDSVIWEQMTEALCKPTTNVNDLGGWLDCLVLRSNPSKTFAEEYNRIMPSFSEVITMLGLFKVDENRMEEFASHWRKQKVVYFHDDDYGVPCFWGPLLFKGRGKVPASPNLLNILKVVQPKKRESKRYFHNIVNIVGSSVALFVVPTSYISLLVTYKFTNFAGLCYNVTSDRKIVFNTFREAWNRGNVSKLGLAIFAATPHVGVLAVTTTCWSYLEDFNSKMSSYAAGTLISLLESLGVQVDDYWKQVLTSVMDVVVMSGIVAAAAVLVVTIYKSIKKYRNKSVEDNQSFVKREISNENSKGEKKPARAKIVKGKGVARLKFVRQNFDDYEDFENFKIRKEIVKSEDLLDPKVFANCINEVKNEESKIYALNLQEKQLCIVKDDIDLFTNEIIDGEYVNEITNLKSEMFYVEEEKKHHQLLVYGCKFTVNLDEIQEILEEYLNCLESLKISEYYAFVRVSNLDNKFHVEIILHGLKSNLSGQSEYFTRNQLSKVNKLYKSLKGITEMSDKVVSDIIVQNCNTETTTILKSVIKKYKVFVSVCNICDFDNHIKGATTFALGHKNYIILNCHALNDRKVIKFWRPQNLDNQHYNNYSMAEVVWRDVVRDIAIAKIISKKEAQEKYKLPFNFSVRVNEYFPSIRNHLLKDKQWVMSCMNNHVICDLPKSDIMVPGEITFPGVRQYRFGTDEYEDRDISNITCFQSSTHLVQKGDCGGIVMVSEGKYANKIVGFHAASTSKMWYGTILTQEDIDVIDEIMKENVDNNDPWSDLIIKGEPEDLPNGNAVTYVGKFLEKTLPAASTDLKHWHYSPWADEFEEQLAPGPLSAYDERITVDVMVNNVGKKSLLMEPNSAMARELPTLDQGKIDWIESKLSQELIVKMRGKLDTVRNDLDDVLYDAMNGRPEWQSVKGIEISKASGIPWAFSQAPLKKDMIDMDENGIRSFKLTTMGQALRNRVKSKLLAGLGGSRLYSFSNSKLKDAVIKNDYVKQGRTRIFHCVPVDSILTDAALFGPFKECFTQLGLEAHHAIGTNPHSVRWKEIYDYINIHPNVFDEDFKNYDKFLHRQIMLAVFNVIRKVINEVAPDRWDKAREVQMLENIETFVVDYQTVYKTDRANKSGSYLTTIINCIANDMYSIYCWLHVTNCWSLDEFRKNVSEVTFGDDKIESVSNRYAKQYNYLTCKSILQSIGHTITPGDKDGLEVEFTTIDKLQFLKRNFKYVDGNIFAPLSKRSIESPFVWTQVKDYEYIVWENLIREQLFEVILHGKQYYIEFINKLKKCSNLELLRKINTILLDDYEVMYDKYITRYYEL